MTKKLKKSISVVIPVYNEEDSISDCLASLVRQTVPLKEIIVVDDGSVDSSKFKVQSSKLQFKIQNLLLLQQDHKGPGEARNLGAKRATGDILVFVDSDMTFAPDFLEKLTSPIVNENSKGAFTKEEYVSNWDNVWARCWNYNQGMKTNRRIPKDYPDKAPVFRAILKSEFEKVRGFNAIGFTDDWTLSRKLGYQADQAKGAICYHNNPSTLFNFFHQARWIGKNEFLVGSYPRRFINLIRYCPFFSLFKGLYGVFIYQEPHFIIFKPVYDFGIWISVIFSFFGEGKYK